MIETLQQECWICGDLHDPAIHGEPLCILQPSLHTLVEFEQLVLDAVEGLGCVVEDLRGIVDSEDDYIVFTAVDRLHTKGYIIVYQEDTFLIFKIKV